MADNSGKSRFYIDNSVWRIDTQKHFFDMMEIQNRRFMYNPDTCTFILGRQYGQSNKIESSHAEEHFLAGASEPFDSFIRGWIGTGGPYKHGVIHFAPNIDGKNPDIFVDAYNTLQMFRENGASADTVIRGFGKAWEQPLSNALPGFTEQTKGEDLINMPMTELKQQLLLQELAKIGFTEAYYIPESDNIKVQPDNDRMPFIRGDDMIFYGTEYDSLVQETIKPLINKVNDMIAERDNVHGYEVKQAVCFSNDRGFALAESPRAVTPFVTWQFTDENGKRDYYWGHYFAKAESAEKDYGKRVDEYKADYPTLTEKYNYLAAAEMSTEQNYNMLDGRINNLPPARADLTDGQSYDEIKELAPETLPGEKPSVTEKLEAAKAEAAKQAKPKKSAPHKSKEAEL